MKNRKITLASILAALATLTVQAQITTRIEGRIIGENPAERTLLFGEYNQDFRIKPAVEIPVKDGRFSYEWTAKDTTAYTICFEDEYVNGSWSNYTVFSEGGTLNIELFCDEADMIVKKNGVTKQYYEIINKVFPLYRQRNKLEDEGNYYTAEVLEILRQISDEKTPDEERLKLYERSRKLKETGESLTSDGKAIEEKIGREHAAMVAAEDSVIAGKPTALGLLYLANRIRASKRKGLSPSLLQAADRYETAFPEHPLTKIFRNEILAIKMKASGGRIPDLRARDLSGNEVSLRSLVTAKFTVLDLWASWCGPCRRHSKELIPVYEEFKSKGFSVLAVAREYKDTGAMKAAMKKDGYPWPSYVDLGDEFQVWQQMGAGNAGGAIFLLDSEGKVIKTNPTTEEIREFLKENL